MPGSRVPGFVGALLRAVGLFALPFLAACSSAPPPPTVVYVQLVAASDANATGGQGAPVAVRVYQLAGKSGFEGAEFYPLYKGDAAALGTDLVKKDEVLLAPGVTKTLTLMPSDAVHAIGVFAAYQAFQSATWRADADVPPNKTTTVTATVGATGLKLAVSPGKPAGL
jgi:type VI secretion system protein VasD